MIFLSFPVLVPALLHSNSFSITLSERRELIQTDSVEIITIYFNQSTYNFQQQEQEKLNSLARKLILNTKQKIRIVGHTDNVGNIQENIGLSENRALVIRSYLLDRRVNNDQIFYTGVGGKYPISKNNTEENRKLNRRVEISLLPL